MRLTRFVPLALVLAAACGEKTGIDATHADAATDDGGGDPGSRIPGSPGDQTGGAGGTAGSGGAGGNGTGGASGGTGGMAGSGGAIMCGPVCDIYCQYGNVLDAHGCPTCSCKPAPSCPALGCDPMCPNGVLKDANGCDTCQCAPTGGACGPTDCPGPRPGAPNVLCPDGKTVSGPACQRGSSGACGWVFVTCPARCVQTVLCIRGSHWDGVACKCVPEAPDGGATVACACSDGGGVCVKQIGGPAIMADPPITCDKPVPGCDGGTVCDCLPAKNGKCHPDPQVQNECICDNGVR